MGCSEEFGEQNTMWSPMWWFCIYGKCRTIWLFQYNHNLDNVITFPLLSIYGKTRSGCGPTKFCWLKLQPNVCQRNRHFFWSNGQTSILLGCCTSLFLWLSFDSEQKWCTPNLIARTFHEHFITRFCSIPIFADSTFLANSIVTFLSHISPYLIIWPKFPSQFS